MQDSLVLDFRSDGRKMVTPFFSFFLHLFLRKGTAVVLNKITLKYQRGQFSPTHCMVPIHFQLEGSFPVLCCPALSLCFAHGLLVFPIGV